MLRRLRVPVVDRNSPWPRKGGLDPLDLVQQAPVSWFDRHGVFHSLFISSVTDDDLARYEVVALSRRTERNAPVSRL